MGQSRATIQAQASVGGLNVNISSLTSVLASAESVCMTAHPFNSLLKIVRNGVRKLGTSR